MKEGSTGAEMEAVVLKGMTEGCGRSLVTRRETAMLVPLQSTRVRKFPKFSGWSYLSLAEAVEGR